jgi:hypothetical protein
MQTDEICEIAVTKNWRELRYVINQTPKICNMAVNINILAHQHIKDNKIII